MLGNSGSELGLRNRIINGGMAIDQRNAGASVSSGLNVVTYTLDRWSVAASGAAVTVQRLGSSGAYYMNVTGAAGNTVVNIRHRIEAANVGDLAGQTVTVSFVCSSSTATQVAVTAGYASATDNFTTVTTIATVNKTINAVGNAYSVQFTLPGGAANGVELIFGVTNFTSGTFSITNVQFEGGQVANLFDRRPIGFELALCQRYLPVFDVADTTSGLATAATAALIAVPFKTTARIVPTGLVTSGTLSNASLYNSTGVNIPTTGISFVTAGYGSAFITVNTASGLVAGNATLFYAGGGPAVKIFFTGCEL
jgi:hypothetical protein